MPKLTSSPVVTIKYTVDKWWTWSFYAMKMSCYLVVTPEYGAIADKVIHAKATDLVIQTNNIDKGLIVGKMSLSEDWLPSRIQGACNFIQADTQQEFYVRSGEKLHKNVPIDPLHFA